MTDNETWIRLLNVGGYRYKSKMYRTFVKNGAKIQQKLLQLWDGTCLDGKKWQIQMDDLPWIDLSCHSEDNPFLIVRILQKERHILGMTMDISEVVQCRGLRLLQYQLRTLTHTVDKNKTQTIERSIRKQRKNGTRVPAKQNLLLGKSVKQTKHTNEAVCRTWTRISGLLHRKTPHTSRYTRGRTKYNIG